MNTTKIGLFGIGLDAYWPQFAGLKERLEGYVREVEGKLVRPGIEIVNLGLIDTPEKAFEAGHKFRQADVDIIFLHVTTYALSSTVLPDSSTASTSLGLACSTTAGCRLPAAS